ncbi:MAG TPA: methyltransferase [Anaerolineae bacterium]|nr:methyltransferase [Anaerolineae bacterium]
MRAETTEDIFELLDGYITSAAVGAAMELGLFWLLTEKPRSAMEVAQSLKVPLNRCQHWLKILCKLGLLEESGKGYIPSSTTRETILDVYSQDVWAYLAGEDRYKFPIVRDLALNISKPESPWELQDLTPPDYYKRLLEDPDEAERFTRALYEIHIPYAEQLANMLNTQGVKRLLDLGGGSGVVSFALLRKQPEMTSVVVDVEHVCRAGRKIAAENALEDRITYLAADYLQDELPSGFDLVTFCDAGPYREDLFRKIHGVLNPDGRLVIVEQFAPEATNAAPSHLLWSFMGSLETPLESIRFMTTDLVQTRLEQAGFRDIACTPVPSKEDLRWNNDWIAVEARR